MSLEPNKKSAGRPKNSEKRRNILRAASALFLQQGYERTSMEQVAKKSDVSKQTVYSHFTNKDQLYNAVIELKCEQYQIENSVELLQSQSLEQVLLSIAESFIRLLTDEEVIAMYTVVIGESGNNPHVANLFYQAGPLHSIEIVQSILQSHTNSDLSDQQAFALSVDFFNLLKGDFHMRSMLGLSFDRSSEYQRKLAQQAVNKTLLLLNAYTS